MNKFLIISVLFLFSLSFEANSQNTENIIKVAIPTKYGNFNIIKEEKISKKSSFNNKRQSVETISDVTTKVYALANELEISDLVKKDLSKYKNYDEDIIVVLSFDKMGKMKSYEYKQE